MKRLGENKCYPDFSFSEISKAFPLSTEEDLFFVLRTFSEITALLGEFKSS